MVARKQELGMAREQLGGILIPIRNENGNLVMSLLLLLRSVRLVSRSRKRVNRVCHKH